MQAENAFDQLDDHGTTPEQARAMLQRLRDEAFEASDEKTAVGLGRTEQEISDVLRGESKFDDDLLIKVRGVAKERNISLE